MQFLIFTAAASQTVVCGRQTLPVHCAPPAASAACLQQVAQTWRAHHCSTVSLAKQSASEASLPVLSSSSSVPLLDWGTEGMAERSGDG